MAAERIIVLDSCIVDYNLVPSKQNTEFYGYKIAQT